MIIKNIHLSKTIFIVMALVMLVSTAGYVVQIQTIMKDSFQEKHDQQQVNVLSNAIQDLDNQYQRLTALDELTPKIQALGLVKMNKLSYLNLSTNQMAIR